MTSDDWDFSRPRPANPSTPAPQPSFGPASGQQDSGFPTGPAEPGPTGFGGWGGGATPFGDPSGPQGGATSPSPVNPPTVWLVAAALAALVGLVAAGPSLSGVELYVGGWALAGPVAITLLTIFIRKDTVRQTAIFYSVPSWKTPAYRAVLVLSLLAIVACALRIADWAGHL